MQVIETHVSRVLLKGPWAYKVKKPLVLPFLDFSTSERRRQFCEEERRINARTAPGLYVDVLPLSVSWEQFVKAPEAALARSSAQNAIDWVLRMRRFGLGDLLSERAAAGHLRPEQIDQLAEHVGRFHRGLPPVPAAWQPHKTLAEWVEASWQAVLAHPGRPVHVTQADVMAARERMTLQLEALSPWMVTRRQAGWVRECHGDLHLANLVQWQGEVMAFDAIEFDADLRCIDVMNDVAFAFMDLLAHGLPALAWRFVSGWVEHTGDADGLRGLRLFAAYRALVRAHVALLGSGGAQAFERYWACLQGLLADPPGPRLWLMMGVSGSGKSTVAALLRDALAARGAPVLRIRSDVERKRWLGVAATDRPTPEQVSEWYGTDATRHTYERLQGMARDALAAGCSVVVDAASLRLAERQAMRDLAMRAGAGFALVACSAPESEMASRLAERQRQGLDASDAGVEVLKRQLGFVEPVTADEQDCTHAIVNDGDLDTLRQRVFALSAWW